MFKEIKAGMWIEPASVIVVNAVKIGKTYAVTIRFEGSLRKVAEYRGQGAREVAEKEAGLLVKKLPSEYVSFPEGLYIKRSAIKMVEVQNEGNEGYAVAVHTGNYSVYEVKNFGDDKKAAQEYAEQLIRELNDVQEIS